MYLLLLPKRRTDLAVKIKAIKISLDIFPRVVVHRVLLLLMNKYCSRSKAQSNCFVKIFPRGGTQIFFNTTGNDDRHAYFRTWRKSSNGNPPRELSIQPLFPTDGKTEKKEGSRKAALFLSVSLSLVMESGNFHGFRQSLIVFLLYFFTRWAVDPILPG